MPELPEVETIKQDLQKILVGKKILSVWTDSPKQLKPSCKVFEEEIVGAIIQEIKRRAKLLQFFLSNGKILVVHLKLSGRLLIRKNGDPLDQWLHAVLKLSEGFELRFCDLRKFGYLRVIEDEKELEKLLAEFGPEPFTPEFTLEKFREILSSFRGPIKLLLMDQKKIAGVGNIYANEALFLAGIAPQKKACDLVQKEPEKVKKLYEALLEVLRRGIKYRGASDQAYLDAFGRKGSYQEHFLVYQQDGKFCPNKCHEVIRRITLGGRGTFFCPRCQR